MSEVNLYHALEVMVHAAEANDYQRVLDANKKFSPELHNQFAHLKNWTMDKKVLMYDRCANSAVYSVTQLPVREEHLQRMKERFSKIPKPE